MDHDIPSGLVLNLDQATLLYASPKKYTFSLKGSKNVSIKSLDDKRQLSWLLLQVPLFPCSFYIKVNQMFTQVYISI